MFRVTRRYEFAASHRLHSVELSEEENRRLYGKCNNPYGHGHNYVVEVSVRGPLDRRRAGRWITALLDELVRREVLAPFEHRNLNAEVADFATVVPTSENLGVEICRRLKRNWKASVSGRVAEAGEDPHRRDAAEHL